MTQESEITFEAAYTRLEEILEKMNAGKVSLEESLKLYEEADRLIAWSNKKLSDAEKKIEILVKNREGELSFDEKGRPLTQEFITANQGSLHQTLT